MALPLPFAFVVFAVIKIPTVAARLAGGSALKIVLVGKPCCYG